MKMLILTITEGPHKGQAFFVPDNASLLVGRHEDAGIKLDQDKRTSRKHAIIGFRDDNAYVLDLASTNGTFINNKKVSGKESLRDGDIVFLGRTYMKISIQGEK